MRVLLSTAFVFQVAAVNRVVETNALTDIVPNYAEAPLAIFSAS